METIYIMVVIDALAAAAAPDKRIDDFVYMVDTNKKGGSTGEGTDELVTACQSTNQGGSTIFWDVTAIAPSNNKVEIQSFDGNMISQRALLPGRNPNGSWSGNLQSNLPAENIQYSMVVSINGVPGYTFDPFLKVSN